MNKFNLVCKGLPRGVDTLEFTSHFSQAGDIFSAKVQHNSNNTIIVETIGYVCFYDEESLEKALSLTTFKETKINIIRPYIKCDNTQYVNENIL